MAQAHSGTRVIDDVIIDFAGRRLLRNGQEQPLEPKAFAVLALLAASPGRAFTRDEILDAVWGHRHVTQSVLNRILSLLRQALGEDAQNPRLLHTVHGVGYRFDLPPPARAAAAAPQGLDRTPWRWPVALGLAVLLVLAALASRHLEPAASRPEPSLAVLPFADLSQSGGQEYLADGLAEEILDKLAQVPALRVVGRASSFSLRGRADDPRDVGRALGVAHLLRGSVRREGDALRVTAQLIRCADGAQLWSRTYARGISDVFAMQDDISRDVAQSLSVKLDLVTYNREQGGTTNIDAYERFLRWRGIVMRELLDPAHDRERLRLAREMVALDPRCVLCLDALAASLDAVAQGADGPQQAQLRAEAGEVRARIARDAPQSWVARRHRANALWREGRRAEAIALARQIAESGPPTKERAWDYAYMLYAMGHLNEAVALVERVRASEPLALFLSRDLQYDYTAARRHDEAEAEYQRGLALQGNQLEPTWVAFVRQLAGARTGGVDELRALHGRLLRYPEVFDFPFFRDLGGALHDRQAMLALVRRALSDADYGGSPDRAYVWTSVADALGDAELAVAAMRRDFESHPGFRRRGMPPQAYVALWNAPFSAVRSHPQFKRLLVESGVADYWRQTGRWADGCRPAGAADFQCE